MAKEHDEYTTRVVRFIIARPLARLLSQTPITPNQVTFFSLILGLIGIFFILQGGYELVLVGSVFSFFYLIFDCVDGELARAKNLTSTLGYWFDGVVGFFLVPATMLALSIGLDDYIALVVGAIASLSLPLQFLFIYFFKFSVKKSDSVMAIPVSHRFDFVRYIYGASLFFPLLFIAALFDKPLWLLFFFATFGNLFWASTLFLQFLDLLHQKNNN